MKKFIIGVLLVAPLFLTGCSKQPSSDNYITVRSERGQKTTFEKVCIGGFVYLYNGYNLTPKIKSQGLNGVIIERCGE